MQQNSFRVLQKRALDPLARAKFSPISLFSMHHFSCKALRMGLYDGHGHQLYLTAEERATFLAAPKGSPPEVRTFCTVLHAPDCRIAEVLDLTVGHVDFAGKVLISEALKKRRPGVQRVVSVRKPRKLSLTSPCRPLHLLLGSSQS